MLEKKESKGERANLKLFYLDIFPSYEEIDENREGIIITFQNSDLIYNLEELIKNREEIFVPQQIPNQITRINLNKSNNLYASGPFTVKNGEQWVTFTYEHKKKQTTNFALSLIDCIKIKFLCKMDLVPAIITQIPSTEIQQKNDSILANIITKPSPKKLYGNSSSKKKNGHNNGNMLEHHDSLHTEEKSKISKMLENPETKSNMTSNLNNTTLSSTKNVNNHLIKSENLSEFNSLSASSGVLGKKENNSNSNNQNNTNTNKNKIVKKAGNTVYNNNLNNVNNSVNIESKKSGEFGPVNQKKKGKNYENNLNKDKEKKGNNSNSMNNIANTIDSGNENKNSKQNLKRNKSKNALDSKIKTNKKEKQTKNVTSNNNSNKENQTIKKIKKDLSTKNVSTFKKEEKENENIKENIYDNNDENNDDNYDDNNDNINDNNNKIVNVESNDMNITSKLINDNYENIEKNNEPLLDEYNEDIDNIGLDNFSKKLDDFQLLYNDDYIKGIKEEDYSLEIELYIEKLIELITEYHIQIEEKDLEYQLVKNMYRKNIFQYLEINKLNKKLELLKDDTILKKNNIKPINFDHDKNYINNLITNKNEINMFNFILYSEKEKEIKEKKEELKKILKIILNKPKYKNIINQNEKIVKWMQINMDKQNQIKEKGKKKNVGKQQKNQQDNKEKVNRNDKKKKNEKNVSNSPSKSKNKLNKNAPEEKGKKK